MDTELSICHSGYETSQDFFNKMHTYSPDIVEHEDSTSFVSHEVVTNENSSMSNTEDASHEDITSSVGEDDAATDGDTPSEAIEEEFNPSTTDNANGYPADGDNTSEGTKEDFDSSNSDISNGAYVDFTITNLEDYFSSLSDVAYDVIYPLSEYLLDTQEFLVDLYATRNMQSWFQRVSYNKNYISMLHILGILVINPFHIYKACSQFWEALLATYIDLQCLDEAARLP